MECSRHTHSGRFIGARSAWLWSAVRHMFHWLSGLPHSLYQNENGQRGVEQTELQLADPGAQQSLPAGAKWRAKIDDGTKRCVRRSRARCGRTARWPRESFAAGVGKKCV